MKYLKLLYVFLFCIIVVLFLSNIHIWKEKLNPYATVVKNSNELMEKIKASKDTYDEQPQDAYIDRVWKKTAGRNGLQVSVEKSFDKMKKLGKYDEKLLVFEQIPPKIHLDELPPSPIYRGHPEKQMVSLLINVSWGEEYIPEILQILKEKQVQATFFIEGKWAKENKNILKMIAEQNHTIGNHAYNHPDMARMSTTEIHTQINSTNEIIEAIIGIKPKWFAPPSGSFNDEVVRIADELEMETILWTVDTIDWRKPSVSVMINRVMKNIHPGATILMHPTEPVANGLASLIEEIKQKDLAINSIDVLLNETR